MGRPKKAAPKFFEPEVESQDPEYQQRLEAEEPDAEEPESSGKRMSKTDAIRAAVAAGMTTSGDGVAYIKKQFGLELSKGHYSATKSKLKLPEGAKTATPKASAPKAASKRRPEPVQDYQTPPEQPVGHSRNLLDALESIKPLIAQYGVDGVKRMADLLG